jgi:hypothetical protein
MPQNFKSWGISFLYSINIQANSSLFTTSLLVRGNDVVGMRKSKELVVYEKI